VHPSSITRTDDDDLRALVLLGCGSIGSSGTPPPSSTKYGGADNILSGLRLNHAESLIRGRREWKWSKGKGGDEDGLPFLEEGAAIPRGAPPLEGAPTSPSFKRVPL
jgi:hypothetical protein